MSFSWSKGCISSGGGLIGDMRCVDMYVCIYFGFWRFWMFAKCCWLWRNCYTNTEMCNDKAAMCFYFTIAMLFFPNPYIPLLFFRLAAIALLLAMCHILWQGTHVRGIPSSPPRGQLNKPNLSWDVAKYTLLNGIQITCWKYFTLASR